MYLEGILIGEAGTIDAVALFFDRSTLFTKWIEQAALALTKQIKGELNEACLVNPSWVLMVVVAAQQKNNSDCSASTPNIGRDLTDGGEGGADSGTPEGWEPQENRYKYGEQYPFFPE